MADPLLSTLCTICHVSAPRYKCPRCGVRTCSLPCVKKHKSWANCSGARDATAYVPHKKLATAAGVDHDYNFLHGVERSRERAERLLIEERGLVRKEELRPVMVSDVKYRKQANGETKRTVTARPANARSDAIDPAMRARLGAYNITLVRAPMGMSRRVENATRFTRKKRIEWQIEWFLADEGTGGDSSTERAGSDGQGLRRVVMTVMDDCTVGEAFMRRRNLRASDKPAAQADSVPEDSPNKKTQKTTNKGGAGPRAKLPSNTFTPSAPQDPGSSTWACLTTTFQHPTLKTWRPLATQSRPAVESLKEGYRFYLSRPPATSTAMTKVISIEPHMTIAEALRNTVVFEYPVIYVLDSTQALPQGFELGTRPKVAFAEKKRKRRELEAEDRRAAWKKRVGAQGGVDVAGAGEKDAVESDTSVESSTSEESESESESEEVEMDVFGDSGRLGDLGYESGDGEENDNEEKAEQEKATIEV